MYAPPDLIYQSLKNGVSYLNETFHPFVSDIQNAVVEGLGEEARGQLINNVFNSYLPGSNAYIPKAVLRSLWRHGAKRIKANYKDVDRALAGHTGPEPPAPARAWWRPRRPGFMPYWQQQFYGSTRGSRRFSSRRRRRFRDFSYFY